MYKSILVPIDGSKLAAKAIKTAVGLSKLSGAQITLFYAAPDYGDVYFAESPALAAHFTAPKFRAEVAKRARELLGAAAKSAGVDVATAHAVSEYPYDAIIRAATKYKADLIVMASHGRRGIKGLLLGSETQKVLTHSKLPVLVVH